MIGYAIWIAIPDWSIRWQFSKQVKETKNAEEQKGLFKSTRLQSAADATTFIESLTKLAPVLAKLGPSVSALLISTICFFLAAATASANHLFSQTAGH